MKVLGIEFAPLNRPLERRLQALAVFAYVFVMVSGGILSYVLTTYLLIYNSTARFFLIPYLLWLYYDRDTCSTGGRGEYWTRWMKNSIWWRYCAAYFPIKLEKTTDLDPSRSYLLCSFPHGMICTGCFMAFCTNALGIKDLFPGVNFRVVTQKNHFNKPIFRDFMHSFGVCSASRESIECLVSNPEQKTAAILPVGGAHEAVVCRPGTYILLLNRRKGFVRLALRTGTPLVPVFSFGETDLYDQVDNPEGSLLRKFQVFVNDLTGIYPLVLMGRGLFQYSFGLMPQRRPVTVVVGSPMEVPKIPEPTSEQVDEYHAKFKENLINLFETHKNKNIQDPENTSLIIK